MYEFDGRGDGLKNDIMRPFQSLKMQLGKRADETNLQKSLDGYEFAVRRTTRNLTLIGTNKNLHLIFFSFLTLLIIFRASTETS